MATVRGSAQTTGRAQADVTSRRRDQDVSQKEDLANFISMITRDETPFMSSIGKTKATGIFHEWQTDELEAPGNSRLNEGADWSAPSASPGTAVANEGGAQAFTQGPNRTRLGNYTQINGKTIAVSGTRRAIDQAGVADEYAYQLKKRGTELRRDVESDLVHSYNVANSSGARTFGSYQSFINDRRVVEGVSTTADYLGATVTGAASTGNDASADYSSIASGRFVPVVADATARTSLSLSQIDSVMQKIYEEGGKASKIMLSPKLRRDFSDLMVTDSGVRRNIDMDGKLRQSVDIYMSDFGDLMVVPNYIMGLSTSTTANDNLANSCALVYDPQWFSLATLRPLQEVDVGQQGDSTVGMMVEECTLEVKNPLGCGAIYNLA